MAVKSRSKRKVTKKNLPTFLNERLALNDEHRKILNAANELSPRDNAWLYTYGHPDATNIPTATEIAKYISLDENTVRKRLNEIKEIWKLPKLSPSNSGRIAQESALILSLTNQHRLRFDPKINDYRLKRVHLMSAELGTGTLYTRDKAFEGERLFRQALNIDEELNSVIFQGGVMPAIMTMYGKIKAEAAALIGLNKKDTEINENEYEVLKKFIELGEISTETPEGKKLTHRQEHNLRKYIVNTLDTPETAAESVAVQIAPLIKNIPGPVPIHFFYSYTDDFNLEEITDHMMTRRRLVKKKAMEAIEHLEQAKDDLAFARIKYGQSIIFTNMANYILENYSEAKDVPTGKKLRDHIKENILYEDNGHSAKGLKPFKRTLKKRFLLAMDYNPKKDKEKLNSIENEFELAFEHAKERYSNATAISSLDVIKSRYFIDKDKIQSSKKEIVSLIDKIREYELFKTAYETEKFEGIGWFTGKIALSPTESKANKMAVKEKYKKIYVDNFLKTLEKIVNEGVPKNQKKILTAHLDENSKKKPLGGFHPHADREISIYIPDPGQVWGVHNYPDNKLYGTILTSIPRVNRQLSDEPTFSMKQLQKIHESTTNQRFKYEIPRPETVEQFQKNHSVAFSDIMITSYGLEGLQIQPKFVIAPTRIKGEYRPEMETVWYVKLPTRHDTARLIELANKGNKRAKEIKRVFKGTSDTGNLLFIEHPNSTTETLAVNDKFYEQVEEKYGETIRKIETKLSNSKSAKMKTYWTNELKKNYELIKEESKLNNVVLANDLHLGERVWQGRPSQIHVIRASQLAAVQTYGFENLHGLAGSEFCNGNQKWRSYDNAYQGDYNDPISSEIFTGILRKKLPEFLIKNKNLKGEALNSEVSRYLIEYFAEDNYAKPSIRADDQIEMFRIVQQPLWEDFLQHKIGIDEATGNHWTASKYNSDEATRIAQLFNKDYVWKEILRPHPSNGQSFTYAQIKLPADSPDEYVKAVLAHKMWHGSTEIAAVAKQAVSTRDHDVGLYIVADRHHGGFLMEEKFIWMDMGKPAENPYVQAIGKVSSARGTVVARYSPKGNQLASAHFFLDSVVDKLTGWGDRSEVLKNCYEIIESEKKNYPEIKNKFAIEQKA